MNCSNEIHWFNRENMALLTDFYELTMANGYLKQGFQDFNMCFEYFFRDLPPNTGFCINAGLEQFLKYLINLRFTRSDLEYLRDLKYFDEEFLSYLSRFKPGLTVYAIPEGVPVFPYEPIIRVEGPLIDTQLVETFLLNVMNYQTLIASVTARICLAAEGDPVWEFGLRRAQGPDGGVSGSRAAYIGGCQGTSNVLAGKLFDIPVSGTHAHSWVMCFPTELEAFRAFAETYPEHPIFLVDTYNTLKSGVPNAIKIFKELREKGYNVRAAIRLDSGDLALQSKEAYKMLVKAGFNDPLIVASNDLDAELVADLKRQQAKINAWGIGTHLITSWYNPALNGVYKLTAVQSGDTWIPRMKRSSNIRKTTDGGKKNIVRYFDRDNTPLGDVLYLVDEPEVKGPDVRMYDRQRLILKHTISNIDHMENLLQPVFMNGKIVNPGSSIHKIRDVTHRNIDSLRSEMKRLRNPHIYPVLLSRGVMELKKRFLENQI